MRGSCASRLAKGVAAVQRSLGSTLLSTCRVRSGRSPLTGIRFETSFSASARVRYKIRTRHSELIFSPSEAPPIPPHAMHSAFVAAVASEAAKRLHGAQGWGRGSSVARRSGRRDARSRSYPRARQGPSTSAARERRTRKPNAGRGTLPLDVLRTVRGARCANGVSARALGYRDDSRFEKRSPEKRVRARGRNSAR